MSVTIPDLAITADPAVAENLADDLDEVLLAAGARISPDVGKRLADLSRRLHEEAIAPWNAACRSLARAA